MEETSATTLRNKSITVRYDFVPDTCPICHRSVSPKFVGAVYTEEDAGHDADLIWQCTANECRHVFIALHRPAPAQGHYYHEAYRVWPKTARTVTFPEEIEAVSPTFIDIYNQAEEAESAELDQLVGIGLRKALEFLVKDYAVHQRKEDEVTIRKTFVGQVINDFVDDANVSAAAKRATWLGNDEAHYVRRWEDKDVKDLRRLIRLTVNWMQNVLLTEKYSQEMPE